MPTRNKYTIILDYWEVMVEEDSWEEGLVGVPGGLFLEADTQVFGSFKALRDHMAGMYSALRKPSAFFTTDKGSLSASWISTRDGDEPTQRQMADFKKGKINLYQADMVSSIRLARDVREPSAAEIARVLKVREDW